MSPGIAALVYLSLGVVALFVSDVIFIRLFGMSSFTRQLQAVKGAVEVLLTAGFILAMMRYSERSLRRSLARSREREQELAVLHRVFRHNLRNKINIILGHAQQAKADASAPVVRAQVDTILEQVTDVSETTEQVVTIEQLSFAHEEPTRLDVVPIVEQLIATYKERTDATFTIDLPSTAPVVANPNLDVALDELVENAIVHNDAAECQVTIAINQGPPDEQRTTITVADNGPGMPDGTEALLTQADVDPQDHLTTLGLWTAYWIVTRGNGEFSIADNEPRGCRIEIGLDTAAPDSTAGSRRP